MIIPNPKKMLVSKEQGSICALENSFQEDKDDDKNVQLLKLHHMINSGMSVASMFEMSDIETSVSKAKQFVAHVKL